MNHRPWIVVAFLGAELCAAQILAAAAEQSSAANRPPDRVNKPTGDVAADEAEAKIVARFLELLERNPRRGTAFDRVYAYYLESGRLEELLQRYQKRTTENPKDAAAWIVLGLVESKRARDRAAVAAFRQAEVCAPDNALVAYYLGQSLAMLGEVGPAAEAFQRAADRNPPPADLIEILQTLARLHQRSLESREAIAVWNRLEKLFPDDPRVPEQIAAALSEDEQYEEALRRYTTMAQKADGDPYRQTNYRIEAAGLKLRLGRNAEALTDYEELLAQLKPESWLYRQVREQIEQSFQREENLAGLADYYERWLKTHADDVDVMVRLARVLAAQGRSAEARPWLDRAIQKAPKQIELRLALVEQLVGDRKYAEAAGQYAELDKVDPNNPDHLRQWGLLLLKDKTIADDQRKQQAAAVWKRLIAAHPNDAAAVSQVADLLRQIEMADEAIALYQQAIGLQPAQAQYREYLGQYFLSLGRREDALRTWREIAAGDRRSAENCTRLSEVLAEFGFPAEAIEAADDACQLAAHDFHVHLRRVELLLKDDRYEQSLERLEQLGKLAQSDEQREAVLDRQIRAYQGAGTLDEQINALKVELNAGKEASTERWCRLARFFEAARRPAEAAVAIQQATRRDDTSVAAWRLAARILEASGRLGDAAAAYRKLLALDRGFRTQYLTSVARVEARLGQPEAALKTARELLAAGPGNPEHFRFLAELCFQLGRTSEGLDTLRRAVRANPGDLEQLLALADALARQFLSSEALELYWQAFTKADDLPAKLSVVSRLTDLSVRTGQFDRLLDRFDRLRRQASSRREMGICMAQAYEQSRDYARARAELEHLLSENDRDTQLLRQLSALVEKEGDLSAAIIYQTRLNQLAPDAQGKARLGQLYLRAGRTEQADAIWTETILAETEPRRALESIDTLLSHGRYDTALAATRRLLTKEPHNWELLYRDGTALAAKDKRDEARTRFQQILKLSCADDDKGASAKSRRPSPAKLATSNSSATSWQQQQPACVERLALAASIRRAAGLGVVLRTGSTSSGTIVRQSGNQITVIYPSSSSARSTTTINVVGPSPSSRSSSSPSSVYSSTVLSGLQQSWSPGDFGQARMAAMAWLLSLAQKDGRQNEQLADFKKLDTNGDQRALWDALYLAAVRDEMADAHKLVRRLSGGSELELQQLYLFALNFRWRRSGSTSGLPSGLILSSPSALISSGATSGGVISSGAVYGSSVLQATSSGATAVVVSSAAPLAAEDVQYMLTCYRGMRAQSPGAIDFTSILVVLRELAQAGRTDEEQAVYREAIESAKEPRAVDILKSVAESRGDVDTLIALLERQSKPAGTSSLYAASTSGYVPTAYSAVSILARLPAEKKCPDGLRLFDCVGRLALTNRPAMLAASPLIGAMFGTSVSRPSMRYLIRSATGASLAVELDYPRPDAFFDIATITLLRSVYAIHAEQKRLGDMIDHFDQRIRETSGDDRLVARLARSCVAWWDRDRQRAIDELRQAIALDKSRPELGFELANLYLLMGDKAGAIAALDSVETTDSATLLQREWHVLGPAMELGNVERARKAAEQLNSQQLTTEQEMQLASFMQRLRMTEQAEAIIRRARRHSGSNEGNLVTVMQEYERQGKIDVAVEVAQQILHGTGPSTPSMSSTPVTTIVGYSSSGTPVYGTSNVSSRYSPREEALRLLSRSGKLDELIRRAESQVEKSPHALLLVETLSDYYRAAGHTEKIGTLWQTFAAGTPHDPQMRCRIAQALAECGRQDAAAEQYALAVRADLSVYVNRFAEINSLFQRYGRVGELLAAVEASDIRKLQSPEMLLLLVRGLAPRADSRALGLTLLEKLYDGFPEQRSSLLSGELLDVFQESPRFYDYLVAALMSESQAQPVQNWRVLGMIRQWPPRGVTNGVGRFLDLAQSQKKLDPLAAELRQALVKTPDWPSGRAVLAMVESRLGQPERARPLFAQVLAEKKNPPPPWARLIFARELEEHPSLRSLAIECYEQTVWEAGLEVAPDYAQSPVARLVAIYQHENCLADAKTALLKYAQRQLADGDYSTELCYPHAQHLAAVVQELQRLGFSLDALRLYLQLCRRAADLRAAGDSNNAAQIDQAHSSLADLLTPSLVLGALAQLPDEPKDGNTAPEQHQPALEVMLSANVTALETAAILSPMAKAILAAKDSPQLASQARSGLITMLTGSLHDSSLLIASALLELASGTAESKRYALERLVRWVESNPLEPPPPKTQATSAQSTAARQLAVWLAAREAYGDQQLRPLAEKLAARAIEAARRQADKDVLMAMLVESGRLAMACGDGVAAESAWRQLLGVLLAQRPLVSQRFLELSRLALRNDLARLSVDCVREFIHATGGWFDQSVEVPRTTSSRISVPALAAGSPMLTNGAAGRSPQPFAIASSSAVVSTMPGYSNAGQSVQIPANLSLSAVNSTMPGYTLAAQATSSSTNVPSLALGAPTLTYSATGQSSPLFVSASSLASFSTMSGANNAGLSSVRGSASLSLPVVNSTMSGYTIAAQPVQRFGATRTAPAGTVAPGYAYTFPLPQRSAVAAEVESQVAEFDEQWRKHSVPAKDVYKVLCELVFPAVRADEVNLYLAPLAGTTLEQARSVGAILVQRAVEAKQVDDLRQRLADRRKQPATESAARLIESQLATALQDRAQGKASLEWFAARMTDEPSRALAELACHAAVPWLQDEELMDPALALLDRAVDRVEGTRLVAALDDLRLTLIRQMAQRGNIDEVVRRLHAQYDGFRLSLRPGSQPSRDYRDQWLALGGEMARRGCLGEALMILGDLLEAPDETRLAEDVLSLIEPVLVQIAAQPPEERYAALKSWVLPAAGVQRVRLLNHFLPYERMPAEFFARADAEGATDIAERSLSLRPCADGVFSSVELLIAAARAAGKLESLQAELQGLVQSRVEHAETLLTLATIASGQGEKVQQQLEALLVETERAMPAPKSYNVSMPWPVYLLARSSAADAKLAPLGQKLLAVLLERAKRTSSYLFLAHLAVDQGVSRVCGCGGQCEPAADPGLAFWHSIGHQPGSAIQFGLPAPWWAERQGLVVHLAGPEVSSLYFDYPLAGTFEFSVDGYFADRAEAALAYGGYAFEPLKTDKGAQFSPVGQHVTLRQSMQCGVVGRFNRLTIRVSPEKVSYLCNGKSVVEDTNPSPTSPWLALFNNAECATAWCNLQISGSPTIPREIPLVQGERMEGWTGLFHRHTLPLHLGQIDSRKESADGTPVDRLAHALQGKPSSPQQQPVSASDSLPSGCSWAAADGVLRGRYVGPAAKNVEVQSWLAYHRPLASGETVAYEFFYEPGTKVVHPCLGRIAFLLDLDAVRLHWITDNPQYMGGALPCNHAVKVGAEQRGPKPLPLKTGEWNRVVLALEANAVVLSLNGVEIYRRAVTPADGRMFGLFFYSSRTSAEVRNVMLKGPWPATLAPAQLANLLVRAAATESAEQERARTALVDESWFALNAEVVAAQARAMAAPQRYGYLLGWVLPHDAPGLIRLYGCPGGDTRPATGQSEPQAAAAVPVLELVSVARQVGKLDDLRATVAKVPVDSPSAQQHKERMLSLIEETP